MAKDPSFHAHQEWLGYVQPVGLVVSIPALLAADAHPNRNPEQHRRFVDFLPKDVWEEPIPEIRDFPAFAQEILGWEAGDVQPAPTELEVVLPAYQETLHPTYAVKEVEPKEGASPWLLLVQWWPAAADLDRVEVPESRHWQASPQVKFERLLRETQVPIGLLGNGQELRLVYAPKGESTGYATFRVAEMATVAGRPIFAALQMLLGADRLFVLPEKQRLPALLAQSRKFQNEVSTKLAAQVLAALYELLRGFQAADEQRKGELLRELLAANPNEVYAGLLTVLLRLVFLLFAEDRDLLSSDPLYINYYSVTGLFERLREEEGRYPDTMDQRYGAWAQLLALFRLVHGGGGHGAMHLPARQGNLFDPERYKFLEGRRQTLDEVTIPRVSDGVVLRVLRNLLILDGERLSYRTLDVEQIGSVYETMMGFNLEVAQGRSIALKPKKSHGAPATVNLEALLAVKGADRGKWLKENADQELTGQALDALKKAATVEDLLAALEKKIARHATPNVVPKGSMVLQPSDERRRSGSHYTPRLLTQPIVAKTLEPILQRLGDQITPQEILDLKICDPAMGSGAFLVETCRQLSEVLVSAWHVHNQVPKIPPDETEELHARRLIAQRCLYGVDRNPMAVDLAKLSLWLATLAREHPFTFLDHALRHGDSLVGLTREQILGFHWQPPKQPVWQEQSIRHPIEKATELRRTILEAGDALPPSLKEQKLKLADEALSEVRLLGDLVVAAFFAAEKDKERQKRQQELLNEVSSWFSQKKIEQLLALRHTADALRKGDRPFFPFHWSLEFPEVFDRPQAGFDAIVGNPPFAGKNTLINGNAPGYLDWLKTLHEESHGNADLVAHFFRRAFNLLRHGGCFGLIATNTIGQGDTRSTGLRWICTHDGLIYHARKRYKWPGLAAVVVSIVHVGKGYTAVSQAADSKSAAHQSHSQKAADCKSATSPKRLTLNQQVPSSVERISANVCPLPPLVCELDGRHVPKITAYLFHAGSNDDPQPLQANANKSFQGSIVLGMGFTFDDTDKEGVANPISLMHELIAKDKRNAELIFPYIGGEEVNDSPTHSHHRYVINFGELTEEEAGQWPDLMQIVESKIKGKRAAHSTAPWWQFERVRGELYSAIKGICRVLVVNCGATPHMAMTLLPSEMVYANTLAVTAYPTNIAFCILQSRIHEIWARFFGSSMKDDLRYTPSDCFETFPFPDNFETDPRLEAVGREYYDFRAALMVQNNEGLTKTYNRFHNPYEPSPDIKKLRDLHAAMDRAVLDAYGWTDLHPTCEFLLDYEEEEDEEESTGKARKKKKPWRYRWPDDFRDEVLARLLELNKERAEQERLIGLTAEQTMKPPRKSRKKPCDEATQDQSSLF